jgi:hypothetical protein
MKVISENCNTGCYSPPPLKEISSRYLRRREHKKWWRIHWPHSKKDSGTVERRGQGTSRSHMSLFLSCVDDITPNWNGWCFMTLLALRFIIQSSWSNNLRGCSEWKRTFSSSEAKDHILHRGKNFQAQSNIGAFEDDLLLDDRRGGIHERTVENMATWLESGPTPCRVLAQN